MFVKCPAFSWAYRHMPIYPRCLGPLSGTLIAGIHKDIGFFTMLRSVPLGNIIDVSSLSNDRV